MDAKNTDSWTTIHPRLQDENVRRDFAERQRFTLDPAEPPSTKPTKPPSPDATDGPGIVNPLSWLNDDGASFDVQFALHEPLGAGGTGVVHLATQHSLERMVAVKMLREEHVTQSHALLMLREAWVAGTLEHPNIVPIHNVTMTKARTPAIVMKRIEGLSWQDLIHKPEMIKERFDVTDPIEWNINTLRSICDAIKFAHARAIIHRDLKPANVMIGRYGEICVVDWGIALSLTPDPSGRLPVAEELTDLAGTPAYMAPEMVDVELGRLTRQTDIYQLGALLYEIFAGVPPHTGKSFGELFESVLEATPHFPDGFPVEVETICRRAMAREPHLRYETAHDFQLAIRDYLQHRESRRLESGAFQSYAILCEAIDGERSEERSLAIFHALGQCRFGFRAALVAWPGNESARAGLDRALLAAISHELEEGHVIAASALLGDVASPPDEIVARVRGATRSASEVGKRLRAREADFDPFADRVARNRRFFLLATAGVLSPVVAWLTGSQGGTAGPWMLALVAFGYLLLGLFLVRGGALDRTDVNRKARLILTSTLVLQTIIAFVGAFAGFSVHELILVWAFTWGLVQGLAGIWIAERHALVGATFLGVVFVCGVVWPSSLLPAVALAAIGFAIMALRTGGRAYERSEKAERAHAEWLAERSD